MINLGKVNEFRRKITNSLTNSLGKSLCSISDLKRIDDVSSIKKILIIRPNHRLGNMLLITPLVQEVQEIFPNATISFFVKGGLSPILFQNYDKIDRYYILPKKHFKELFTYLKSWFSMISTKHDLVINVAQISSSGKLATKFSKSKYKFFGNEFDNLIKFSAEQSHFAKLPVYKFRNYIYTSPEEIYAKPIKEIDLKLSEKELAKGKSLVIEIIPNPSKETIAIFTFATGNKCYLKKWWMEFYEKLILNFPNYNIIEVLPVENVSQINFKAPTFYSKDIREIASFISNTKIFIGADSGMMHLACATKTNVIGLFSVTPKEKYGPFGNRKIGINTNEVSKDGIIESVKNMLENKII
jgi:ADP-heptose:LPS heptosyltransferase